MRQTIKLPEVEKQEIERMEEVKFWLFASKLGKLLRGAGAESDTVILSALAEITNTNETLLISAYRLIDTVAAMPHEIEVAVTARYMDIPYNTIVKHLMHSKKYRDLTMEYIENQRQNMLVPKLPQDLTDEIIKFNSQFNKKLAHIFTYMCTEFNYEEVEQWNS